MSTEQQTELPPSSAYSDQGTTPVPVSEHKYKKKRPIYNSDLEKLQTLSDAIVMPQLSPMEQVIGIVIGIGLAWGGHQLLKMLLGHLRIGYFTKKACCALPPPTEIPVPEIPTP